jgi:hypothetical protein
MGAMFDGMYAAGDWRRPAREKMMSEILTDEQIENWRRVMIGMFGPYALLVTREQIQAFRDNMQKHVDSEPVSKGEKSVQ